MHTAVVTGAGKGLGRVIAQGLADKGYAVLVTDIDRDAAEETAALIGGNAWAMEHDVRDPDAHRDVAQEADERGPLKVWVNNAGVLTAGSVWDLHDDNVRRHVEVNVLGFMWGSRAAVDVMRLDGGHIINIASLSSLTPAPLFAVYGATKHAALAFSISLQGDLQIADLPIKVSAVCPDAIDTDLVRENTSLDEAAIFFSGRRLLTVEEVAEVVLELVDKPRLVVTVPRARGALAHALRPFPAFSLKALAPFRWVGARNLKAFRRR